MYSDMGKMQTPRYWQEFTFRKKVYISGISKGQRYLRTDQRVESQGKTGINLIRIHVGTLGGRDGAALFVAGRAGKSLEAKDLEIGGRPRIMVFTYKVLQRLPR